MLTQCVSAEMLDRLHAGELPEPEETAVRAHLQTCMQCARKEAELLHAHERLLHDVRVLHGSGLLRAAAPAPEISSSAPPPHADRPIIAPNIAGYRIVEEISRGGQGVVYRAIQESTKREVALKVLRDGAFASQSAKLRFQREIELAAGLRHAHIITIFDSGVTAEGMQFCVMDYVRGLPLLRHITEYGLTLERSLDLFAAVCEAVEFAHTRDILHRDLKPSNILVDVEGQPRVLDFGLARLLADPRQTLMSGSLELVGTLPYMAPEQAAERGQAVDRRTDVYALGVILYEMLTGRSPYPVQGRVTDVLRHICETPPLSLRRAWNAPLGAPGNSESGRRAGRCPLDTDIETIVAKALAKEPERRYATAGELATDVRRYMRGEAIAARPASAVYRARKFVRRRRVALGLSGLAAAAVIAAGATMYFQSLAGRAAAAQRREEARRLYFEAQAEAYRYPKNAVALYERAIERDPEFLDARIRRAFLLHREISTQDAGKAAEEILAQHPDCGPAHLLLGQVYRLTNPQHAAKHREEGLRLAADDLYYRAAALDVAQSAEAVELLTKLLAEDGSNLDARSERAWRNTVLRNPEAVLADAEVLRAIQPKSPDGWVWGGAALDRLDRHREAMEWYDEAVRLAPNRYSTRIYRAELFLAMGEYQRALADCDRAIELMPRLADAFALRARIRYVQGDRKIFLDDLETSLSIDPDCGLALTLRGRHLLEEGKLQEAYDSLHRALSAAPASVDVLVDLGKTLNELGRHGEAVEYFAKALSYSPNSIAAHTNRAQAYEALGESELAVADYTRVIELDPNSSFEIYSRAHLCWELGRIEEALADFRRAGELAPSEPGPPRYCGALLWVQGDLPGAIDFLEHAMSLMAESEPSQYFWLWELYSRRGQPGDAETATQMLARVEDIQMTPGYANLLRHCRGELTDEALVAAAQNADHQCDAYFHLAAHAGIAGDRSTERAWLNQASAVCPDHTDEFKIARQRLSALDDRLAGH